MNNLFVLDEQPRFLPQYMADIHLRPALQECLKVISSSLQQVDPKGVQVDKSIDGVKQFKWNGFLLLPPYPGDNLWVNWVAGNYHHIWWIVQTMWCIDKELQHRFNLLPSLQYLRVAKLVEEGFVRCYPKPDSNVVKDWPDPFSEALAGSVRMYREHYKQMRIKGDLRMKWTNREMPDFVLIKPADVKVMCSECQGPMPATAGCGVSGCPFEVN